MITVSIIILYTPLTVSYFSLFLSHSSQILLHKIQVPNPHYQTSPSLDHIFPLKSGFYRGYLRLYGISVGRENFLKAAAKTPLPESRDPSLETTFLSFGFCGPEHEK